MQPARIVWLIEETARLCEAAQVRCQQRRDDESEYERGNGGFRERRDHRPVPVRLDLTVTPPLDARLPTVCVFPPLKTYTPYTPATTVKSQRIGL